MRMHVPVLFALVAALALSGCLGGLDLGAADRSPSDPADSSPTASEEPEDDSDAESAVDPTTDDGDDGDQDREAADYGRNDPDRDGSTTPADQGADDPGHDPARDDRSRSDSNGHDQNANDPDEGDEEPQGQDVPVSPGLPGGVAAGGICVNPDDDAACRYVAVSGTGDADGGPEDSFAVSITGDASADTAAASATGDADADTMAVTGTGEASGCSEAKPAYCRSGVGTAQWLVNGAKNEVCDEAANEGGSADGDDVKVAVGTCDQVPPNEEVPPTTDGSPDDPIQGERPSHVDSPSPDASTLDR